MSREYMQDVFTTVQRNNGVSLDMSTGQRIVQLLQIILLRFNQVSP